MYIDHNENPQEKRVGDCVVRALSCALGEPWEMIYTYLMVQGYKMADMPSSNAVWGSFLRGRGWERTPIPNTCPECYTVRDFCKEHPKGTYILALQSHVVCAKDGNYYDTWDSGDETVLYFWRKAQ